MAKDEATVDPEMAGCTCSSRVRTGGTGTGCLAAWWIRLARALGAVLLVAVSWTFLVLPAIGFALGSKPTPDLAYPIELRSGCRLERIGETWHCHLAGSALERGYACGRLTAPIMARHEEELFTTLEELVPSFWFRHVVLGLVTGNNRRLDSFLLEDELLAIAGIARGYRDAGDPNATVAPTYTRVLGYHALHDASQYLIDNPLVNAPPVGCSALAVDGERTSDGHLLVGRLFDFEGGRSFDADKVVYTVDPGEGGLRFVNVAWGGVHGAVTGMNEAGLWISMNAGVSDRLAHEGRPLVVAAQRALETCATIDAAIGHLTSSPVFVSESVLIASARAAAGEPYAVALELAPGKHRVRPIVEHELALTNHFLHPDWADDEANRLRQAEGTTQARYARLRELLAGAEPHTPATLCELLRDRRGAAGRDLGFGHRSSINAWIGSHLVVADLTAGLLWVAEPAHGLGRASAFDVNGPRPDVEALPASIDLELYRRYGRTWKRDLERARRLAAARDPAAEVACRRLIEVNPQHYEPYALLARVVASGEEQRALLEASLERSPAYASEARDARRRLAELVGGSDEATRGGVGGE